MADLQWRRLFGLGKLDKLGIRVGHRGDQQAEQDDGRDGMTSYSCSLVILSPGGSVF